MSIPMAWVQPASAITASSLLTLTLEVSISYRPSPTAQLTPSRVWRGTVPVARTTAACTWCTRWSRRMKATTPTFTSAIQTMTARAFQYRESFSPAMDNYQEAKWLVNHKLFRQFFPPNFPDSWLARSCGGSEAQKQAASLAQIVTARNYLHLAWKATDSDERAWRIRALREFA